MKYSVLFIGVLMVTISISTQAQPVRDGVIVKFDSTSSMNHENLSNHSFDELIKPYIHQDFQFDNSQSFHLNKTAKTLLKIGTSFIRGNQENFPMFSLENAWKYPGPTVRYPETASEYKLFLSRFNEYNPNGN
ncbi:hypothetical protein [Fodinibius sp. Rm-B-1B1-1]|uniref:hypothetical protein n=1 Tax=Fodinibius alkaliphilus TaxID=3140241 RepID=UPI003159C584